MHFFTRLVFSPVVWLGMVLFVVAFVLIGASNFVTRTQEPEPKPRKRRAETSRRRSGTTSQPDPLIDDEMAEIQAILKKRGIS